MPKEFGAISDAGTAANLYGQMHALSDLTDYEWHGQSILPSSGFTKDQNRAIRLGDFRDLRKDFPECLRGSDDFFKHRDLINFVAQRDVLVLKSLLSCLRSSMSVRCGIPNVSRVLVHLVAGSSGRETSGTSHLFSENVLRIRAEGHLRICFEFAGQAFPIIWMVILVTNRPSAIRPE